jgi:hypothetical protein
MQSRTEPPNSVQHARKPPRLVSSWWQ